MVGVGGFEPCLRQAGTDLPYGRSNQLSPYYGSLGTETEVVGVGGFEPPTSPLSGVRSNQLSYTPTALPDYIRRDDGPSTGGGKA